MLAGIDGDIEMDVPAGAGQAGAADFGLVHILGQGNQAAPLRKAGAQGRNNRPVPRTSSMRSR